MGLQGNHHFKGFPSEYVSSGTKWVVDGFATTRLPTPASATTSRRSGVPCLSGRKARGSLALLQTIEALEKSVPRTLLT